MNSSHVTTEIFTFYRVIPIRLVIVNTHLRIDGEYETSFHAFIQSHATIESTLESVTQLLCCAYTI